MNRELREDDDAPTHARDAVRLCRRIAGRRAGPGPGQSAVLSQWGQQRLLRLPAAIRQSGRQLQFRPRTGARIYVWALLADGRFLWPQYGQSGGGIQCGGFAQPVLSGFAQWQSVRGIVLESSLL